MTTEQNMQKMPDKGQRTTPSAREKDDAANLEEQLEEKTNWLNKNKASNYKFILSMP